MKIIKLASLENIDNTFKTCYLKVLNDNNVEILFQQNISKYESDNLISSILGKENLDTENSLIFDNENDFEKYIAFKTKTLPRQVIFKQEFKLLFYKLFEINDIELTPNQINSLNLDFGNIIDWGTNKTKAITLDLKGSYFDENDEHTYRIDFWADKNELSAYFPLESKSKGLLYFDQLFTQIFGEKVFYKEVTENSFQSEKYLDSDFVQVIIEDHINQKFETVNLNKNHLPLTGDIWKGNYVEFSGWGDLIHDGLNENGNEVIYSNRVIILKKQPLFKKLKKAFQ